MPTTRPDSGSNNHHAGLILRVVRRDGHAEEFYMAAGLTIGRSMANTIVLADDESVDRTHARVEVDDDGAARLRCIESSSSLMLDGRAARDLPLNTGIRFQIGRAMFECVSGRRGAGGESRRPMTSCPFCGSATVPTASRGIHPCPACEGPVMPVLLDPRSLDVALVPAVFGEYRVERYVSRGGMGLVFKGIREVDAQPVAIKVILPGTITHRRDAERFRREVAMLARVRHPNVVKLLGRGRSGRFNYLAMEWIEGPDLRSVIADARLPGRLTDFAVAFRWFRQVAMGLSAIDEAGMVHRDVKPSNILIGPSGVAKIADLGIARQVDFQPTAGTTTGQAPGTVEYMAPEQLATPDQVDRRADLYGLGVTFYELLTGMRPCGAWRQASLVNPTVPGWFDAMLGRLMAPMPGDRFDDAEELLSAIHDERSKSPGKVSGRSQRDDVVSDISHGAMGAGPVGGSQCEDRPVGASTPTGPKGGLNSSVICRGVVTGARNGTIWGVCMTLPCGGLLGILCYSVADNLDAWFVGFFIWATFILSGFICGSIAGAIWGLKAVIFDGPLSIQPVTFKVVIRSLARSLKRYFTNTTREPKVFTAPVEVEFGPPIPPTPSARPIEVVAHPPMAEKGPGSTAESGPEKPKKSPGWAGWITYFVVGGMVKAYFFPTHRPTPRYDSLPSNSMRTSKAERWNIPSAINSPFDAVRQELVTSSIRRGNYDEAIAECNRTLVHGNESQLALSYRGLAYAGKRDFARASDDCIRAVNSLFDRRWGGGSSSGPLLGEQGETIRPKTSLAIADGSRATIYANRAAVNLQKNDPDAAIVECNLALAIDPNSAVAFAHRASAHCRKGSFDLADSDADRALALAPNLFEARVARGEIHLARGRYDPAIADLGEAIRCEPAAAGPYDLRARARIEKGELDLAMADAEEAIKLNPTLATAYSVRAMIWLGKGELERTIADSGEAIRLLPAFAEPHVWRGAAYRNKGAIEPAIKDLSEAISLDPAAGLSYLHRGIAYLVKEDLDRAISDFDAAILRDPTGAAQAYSNRALAYSSKGEWNRAMADCDEAIKLDASLPEAYLWRGSIFHRRGDHDRAIREIGEAIRLDPSLGLAFNNRGLARYNKRDYELALVDYDQAIRLEAANPIFLANRGLCHRVMRSYDAAVADFEAALRLDPSHSAEYRKLIEEVAASRAREKGR